MQYHTGKKRTFNFVHSQTSLHPHQNIDREAHHSPTWHGSESESALERFEPVAVVMLQSDGQGTLFAPEGDDCLQRAKREDTGRFSKEGKSLDDFWYFSSRKSTREEKYLCVFLRVVEGADPLSRRRQHTRFAYVLIPAFSFAYAGAKEKAIKKKTPI